MRFFKRLTPSNESTPISQLRLAALPSRFVQSSRVRWATAAAVLLSTLVTAQHVAALPDPKPRGILEQESDRASARRTGLGVLPPLVQASISAAIGRDQSAYHADARSRSVRMQNGANSLAVDFTSAGVDLRQGDARFGMALRGYGRGDRLQAVSSTLPRAEANRVEYRRGALTEWYANGPLGLEQGFTLERASGATRDGPLTLAFGLSGNLSASIDPGARGLTLDRNGAAVLHYAGLMAMDAKGRDLPAWLELAGRELRLRVDDAGAAYPLTIDPILGAVKLTNNKSLCSIGGICEVGSAGDRFGFSVAVSNDGNTVAVAAPHATGSNVDSGAVYVFVKPFQFGWGGCITIGCTDYRARITSTPGGIQHGFGASVAISGDGNTIAVLTDTLPQSDSSAGIVYVYQKPPTGWASTGQFVAILSVTTVTETPCGFSGNATDCSTDFSSSIAVNGDGSTIVLGYSGALVSGLSRGAAYVFVRPVSGWVNSASPAKLTRSGGAHLDDLGQSVAISSDDSTIAVAAPLANGWAGAVEVFVKGGSSWVSTTPNAELTYAPGDGLLFLGNSVDISSNGGVVVAGGNGRALIFPMPTVRFCAPICFEFPLWVDRNESAQLTTSNGTAIARPRISGDGTRVVASDFESPGSVYAYIQPASGWASATEGGKFGAPDGAPGNLFGYSSIPGSPAIDMSDNGSVLLVGAPGATVGSNANQGAAYIFLPEPGGAVSLLAGAVALFGLEWRRRRSRRQTASGARG